MAGTLRELRIAGVSSTFVQPDPRQTAEVLKRYCLAQGFDLVGIAPVQRSAHEAYVRQWLASGQAAGMEWMAKHVESLVDARRLLADARSVICVAASYHFPVERPPADAEKGLIARYALGEDYHEVFKDRIHDLADYIRATWPGAHTKCGVDITPIMEREYAAAAGLGWVGKNTCILNQRRGSWILLGEVMTSLELAYDTPVADLCGSCTRCIDACPTQALHAPYRLDAGKCISYLNIEHRAGLDEAQQQAIGRWLVGCDLCQDVCPFNRKAETGTLEALRPRACVADGAVDLRQVLSWDEAAYRAEFRRSAVRRVKLPMLQQNARTVLANVANSSQQKRT